jgi:hypothetical protein
MKTLKSFLWAASIICSAYAFSDNLIPYPILPKSCNGIKELPQKQIAYYYKHDFEKFKAYNLKITEENNNIGGEVFNFQSGKKVVYRSSILNGNPTCMKELTQDKNVATVIYLYNGPYVDEKEIPYQEKEIFTKYGGEFYINALDFEDTGNEAEITSSRNHKISDIIKYIAVSPKNVLIHCLGGMHRTGLIYGILQKCINHEPEEKIIEVYKKHVGYKSKDDAGTFYQEDIDTIKAFPCNYLN